MIRIILTFLFIILASQNSLATCSWDDSFLSLSKRWENSSKPYGQSIPGPGGTLSCYDQRECPVFTDNSHSFHSFLKVNSLSWDQWYYFFADGAGVSAVCKRGMPVLNFRYYFKRNGTNIFDASYEVGTGICSVRYLTIFSSDQQFGYCKYPFGSISTVNFSSSDIVDLSSSTGYKTVGRHPVCLVRYQKGDAFRHTQNPATHDAPNNKVCAYLTVAGFPNCRNPYGLDWNAALIGCLDEPGLPGPDVYNSLLPAQLSPFVDTSICLDNRGNGSSECNSNVDDNLIARGSTFDRPVVVLSGGEGGSLALQYTFHGDDAPDGKNLNICDSFTGAGGSAFSNQQYCAFVPPDAPDKVCACLRRDDIGSYEVISPGGYKDYCGSNPAVGCVDRPTLEHSNLKLVTEFAPFYDSNRQKNYPAVRPVFARTDGNQNILYVDDNGDDACYNNADSRFYKCGTSQFSIGNVTYKERLPLPPANSTPMREYFLDIANINYECRDDDNDIIKIDEDAKFYKTESGAITTIPANGTPNCTGLQIDGYRTDTATYYGVNMNIAIPELDGSFVKFARYTSDQDELPVNAICTPLKMTTICDPRGTTAYVPDGVRNTEYCDIPSLAGCESYNKGPHEEEAVRIFCPGTYTEPVSTSVSPRICILPTTQWHFQTIQGYREFKENLGTPAQFLQECDRRLRHTEVCSPIDLGCPRIDVPDVNSGFSAWPAMQQGETLIGSCDAALGYTDFIRVLPVASDFTLPATDVCANNTSSFSCSQFYGYYQSVGNQLIADLEAANNDAYANNRNYTEAEAVAAMTNFYNTYLGIAPRVSFSTPETVERTCNGNGASVVTGKCVAIP